MSDLKTAWDGAGACGTTNKRKQVSVRLQSRDQNIDVPVAYKALNQVSQRKSMTFTRWYTCSHLMPLNNSSMSPSLHTVLTKYPKNCILIKQADVDSLAHQGSRILFSLNHTWGGAIQHQSSGTQDTLMWVFSCWSTIRQMDKWMRGECNSAPNYLELAKERAASTVNKEKTIPIVLPSSAASIHSTGGVFLSHYLCTRLINHFLQWAPADLTHMPRTQ